MSENISSWVRIVLISNFNIWIFYLCGFFFASPLVFKKPGFLVSSFLSGSTIFLLLLQFPEPWGEGVVETSCVGPSVTQSLSLCTLSICSFLYCSLCMRYGLPIKINKEIIKTASWYWLVLWWWLRKMLIYEYSRMSRIPFYCYCSLSRTVEFCFPLGP